MFYEAAKRVLAGNPLYEAVRRVRVRNRIREQERLAEERHRYAVWLATKSDKERKAIDAAQLCRIKGARVLVVGANEGDDCRLFVELGASEVHGLDIVENVGSGFQHPRVRYHCVGIEKTGLKGNYFDLVYSFATMEHVGDIKAGFTEMVRLARRGGIVLSHAAPLWQSPYGHHMSCFQGHPWAHLVHADQDGLVAYARSHGIEGERGHSIEGIVGYMLNPAFFNMKPGDEFVEICSNLGPVELLRNHLVPEEEVMLEHPLGKRALAMGYTRQNLLGVLHEFVARKL